MSETLLDQGIKSANGVNLSKEARAEAVNHVIEVLNEVASGHPEFTYHILPVQPFDNFEVAAILTDAACIGEMPANTGLVRYLQGSYHGKDVEFAVEHSSMDREDPENVVVAWGVRQIDPQDRQIISRVARIPSSIFDNDQIEIGKLQEPDMKALPRAA